MKKNLQITEKKRDKNVVSNLCLLFAFIYRVVIKMTFGYNVDHIIDVFWVSVRAKIKMCKRRHVRCLELPVFFKTEVEFNEMFLAVLFGKMSIRRQTRMELITLFGHFSESVRDNDISR